ncbi:MAG: sugar nucleotide-binding protein, partial [Bacteroidales bacterium]
MAKILVTGANGQLGNELRIVSMDDAKNTYLFTDVIELDITDKDAVNYYFSVNKPDIIVNCAAYTAVDRAESERERCNVINVDAVRYLAEASGREGCKMIHISTDYVYGGCSNSPYSEDDITMPQSVYGETKLAGEKVLLNINNASVVIRTAWLYSPFGKNFVKTMIALGKEREEIN